VEESPPPHKRAVVNGLQPSISSGSSGSSSSAPPKPTAQASSPAARKSSSSSSYSSQSAEQPPVLRPRPAPAVPQKAASSSSSTDHKLPPIAIPAPLKQAKQGPLSLTKGKIRDWRGEVEIDVPDGIIAPGLSSHLHELIAVVGLRGGSRVMGGLSARELANIAVRDWSDDFTVIVGDHRCRCPSSVAQFLSPRLSKFHWVDATISELRLEVEDRDNLFGSVLEAARGGDIVVDSAHRPTFVAICAALWNSELYESVCGQLSDEVRVENVVNRLRFLSTTRCDISLELEFIASHFYDFLRRPDALNALPFSLLYEIITQGCLRIESEDCLYDFISHGIETNQEMFSLLEFVRLPYCSTDVMDDFFYRLSGYFYEINASMWASLRARLVLPNRNKKPGNQFPPLVKKRKLRYDDGSQTDEIYDIPDGIIAHLTRECGENVHDRHIVDVTSGSFEQETCGANPYSGACDNKPYYSAKNTTDLETVSIFFSAYRRQEEDISHTRNNWVCYDFKRRRILPTHYTIRTLYTDPGSSHLKYWSRSVRRHIAYCILHYIVPI
jgi:hypothetical protein